MGKYLQLSEAIDAGMATLAHNRRPEGWRLAEFNELAAYVSPDCPELVGEIFPEATTARVKVTVAASVHPNDWHRVASKIAREAAASRGIAWKDADVFVELPESGRFFTKSPGRTALVAHG